MANCALSRRLEGEDLEEWKRLLSSFLKQLHVPVCEFANKMGVSRQAVYYWLKSSKVDWTVFLASLIVFELIGQKKREYDVDRELSTKISQFYHNIFLRVLCLLI